MESRLRGSKHPPKRLSLAHLDGALFKLALAEQGKRVPDEWDEEDLPDDLPIRYTPDVCMDLWLAWREHGTMPVSGGYLDQPAAWRKIIKLFNSRHHLAYKAVTGGEEWADDDGQDATDTWGDLTS